MRTLTRSCLIALLALFVVFLAPPAANAQYQVSDDTLKEEVSTTADTPTEEATDPEVEEASGESANSQISYQVPGDVLESSLFDVSPDPNGPSVLVSVHNTDDEPLGIDVRLLNADAIPMQNWVFMLDPHQILPLNLRDHISSVLYPPNPDGTLGILQAMIEVFAERAVAAGDIITLDTSGLLAEGELLKSRGAKCTDRCEKYYLRYLQGGPFNGGTNIRIRHKGNYGEHPTIRFQLFDEAGTFTDAFNVVDAPAGTEVNLSDYTLQSPFGGMYINIPGTGEPTVVGRYLGFGNFSLAWRPYCVPVCDPTDPNGACYAGPPCIRPTLSIVSGGSTTCQVGVPFHAVLRATGSGLGEITCLEPLPDGIFFDENTDTLDGECENTNVPSIFCSVPGRCGTGSRTIPVTGETPTYGVNIEKVARPKDCLHPGDTEVPITFDITVENLGSVVENISISDPSVPQCNHTPIALNPGAEFTHACIEGYSLGTHVNTAIAIVEGHPSVTDTDAATVIIEECAEVCDGVQLPTVHSFTQIGEDFDTVFTRARLDFAGAGVTGTIDYLNPFPSGGWQGGSVVSGQNNDSSYTRTPSDFTASFNWKVWKGGEICHSNTETLVIHAQTECDDYPEPPINFGTPVFNDTLTTRQVLLIPASPSGGTWNRPLPSELFQRPLWGEPDGSETFVYDVPYEPIAGLTCHTSRPITVPIPSQAAACPPQSIDVTVTADTDVTATAVIVNFLTATPSLDPPVVDNPTTPDTTQRPAAGQPSIFKTFTKTGTRLYQGLQCPAGGSVVVEIPARTQTCADFPTTAAAGAHTFTEDDLTYTVTGITVTTSPNRPGFTVAWASPPGVPTVPALNKPVYGQTASQTFNGVVTFVPATGLTCTAPVSKTIAIPAQTCEVSNPPSWDQFTVTEGNTNFTGSVRVRNSGEHEVHIHATSSEGECNAHNYDHWNKDTEKVDLSCGQGPTVITASYQWSGHPDEWWRVEYTRDGVRVTESTCRRNTRNLMPDDAPSDLAPSDGIKNDDSAFGPDQHRVIDASQIQ